MGAITGRFTRYDISAVIISGVTITSMLTDASLDITADDIDVNALQDTWNQREFGRNDWSLSVTKLATGAMIFPTMVAARAVVGVTVRLTTGLNFYANGRISGGPVAYTDAITESATFIAGGGTPTINTT